MQFFNVHSFSCDLKVISLHYVSDGACRTDVKTAISGYQVIGSKKLSKGESYLLEALGDSSKGVMSAAMGVYTEFHSYKVRY